MIHLATIAASLFLFPGEWYTLLKRAHLKLERQKEERTQAARDVWLFWALQARQSLKRKAAAHQQVHLLRRALAYGERYLQTAAPSEEPRVYQLTVQICQALEQRLQCLERSKKRGQAVTT